MPITIESEIPKLQQRLEAATNRVKREKPSLLKQFVGILRRLSVASFTVRSRGGSSIGVKWKSLSEKYRQWKQRKGYSTRIGIRTGLLRRSHFAEVVGIERVTLEYEVREKSLEGDTAYHPFFDKSRSIFKSDDIPPAWVKDEIEPAASKWLDEIITSELGDLL